MTRTSDPAISDEELMVRVREQNDQDAFAVLVSRHQQNLLNYFVRSGVQYDGEDLVQQTFLRIFRYRDRYVPSAKFTTFLLLVARQVWLDELRKRKRRERGEVPMPEESIDVPVQQDVSDTQHVENRQDVLRLLETLPDGLRQVIVLGVFEERPYAEIGRILGIPEGTVKSRMFHALARMREFLRNDESGSPMKGKKNDDQRTSE